jgi:hypothetical protein
VTRRSYFGLRVGFLLGVLVFVALYAWKDVHDRRERNEFSRTLEVGLVLVTDGTLDPRDVELLKRRVPVLEERLKQAFESYRGSELEPFTFVVSGPVPLEEPLPVPAEGLVAAVRYAYQLHRFTRDVDARAAVSRGELDSRIYLVLRSPSEDGIVEGMSEQGGRIGIALAELDPSTTDLALFVAAHELFHTLGATDKYDPTTGRAILPDGLAEPGRLPRVPQRYVEVMARNRPIAPGREVRPESLDELWVGKKTAREIGWLPDR